GEKDLIDIDILFIIGSSLTVSPSNLLPKYVNDKCLRVFINLTPPPNYYHYLNPSSRDIWLKGNCDDIIKLLIKTLQWENDIKKLIYEFNNNKINININNINNNNDKKDNDSDNNVNKFR